MAELLQRYRNAQTVQYIVLLVFIALLLVTNNVLDGLKSICQGGSTSDRVGTRIGQRYAVAHYAESKDQIYGIYSVHRQMAKHGMLQGRYFNDTLQATNDPGGRAAHVVVVPSTVDAKLRSALVLWLGEENVRTVNNTVIKNALSGDRGVWVQTFNKLWLWNLTEFSKVVMLDADVLIRTNIMHWFDYPTPCGIQAKDDTSWNSGAMVIKPDTEVFQHMLSLLADVRKYDPKEENASDPLNGGYSDQDFITAFFLNNTEQARGRCIMPTEAAVLSSSLGVNTFVYFEKYRPWLYQTIHFTTDKPWRNNVKTAHPFLCQCFREFNESMRGVDQYYGLIPPLKNNYLADCAAS